MDFEVQALAMVRYVEGRPDWPVSDSRVDNLHCVPFFLGGGGNWTNQTSIVSL